MVGGNNHSPKREWLTEIGSLPDAVLFDVLVRLEAQEIYDSARLVCRKWYHMTHTHTFIYAHLERSTYGLLFQSKYGSDSESESESDSDSDSVFMTVGESGQVEISKNMYNIRCPVQTSCNGLLLELEFQSGSKYNLYVSNPVTGQNCDLPSFVDWMLEFERESNINLYEIVGIAYAEASMEYKAVLLLSPGGGEKRICCILTIGVDNSWRTIGSECESLATSKVFTSAPLISEGFVHWYDTTSNEVLTLNVETEIITETSGPTPEGNQRNIYLSTGRYLSLLRTCGQFCWEVWEMKPKIDYQWRKVWDISLEAHNCSTFERVGFNQYYYLIPIGWLKYLEVLVFFSPHNPVGSQIFVYNLLTHEILTVELPDLRCNYKIVVHKNSLVRLDGC
ncbi:hypothetical protein CASFOL_026512 [Castilleja foliolosa]|uniref:F-box domain-containing protein n=1 Tax=Castilleja foliolosa TaxID=1961234 RepID=A0ABD3CKL1_9LAMI